MKELELKELKKELYLLDLLQEKANFSCYSDDEFTYYIKEENGLIHEFNLCGFNLIMFANMKVCDLIDLKNLHFFHYKKYLKIGNNELNITKEFLYKKPPITEFNN